MTLLDGLKKKEVKRVITPVTWTCLQQGYFFSRRLRFHPYSWDSALNVPVVGTKLLLWYLHFVSAIVFYALILARLAEVLVIRPGSIMETMYVLFVACFFSIFILLQVHSVFRRERFVHLMQDFFSLTTKCEGNLCGHLSYSFEIITNPVF